MAAADPTARHRSAKKAGNARAASRTPAQHAAQMAKARAALQAELVARVDPDGTLALEEQQRRVRKLRSEMARSAAAARHQKAAARRRLAEVIADNPALARVAEVIASDPALMQVSIEAGLNVQALRESAA